MMPFLVRRFGSIRTFNGAVLCSALILVPLALIPHWTIAGLCLMGTMCLAGIRRPTFTVFPTGNDATALADSDGRSSGHHDRLWLCWRIARWGDI